MSRTKFWYVSCDDCGIEGADGEGSHAYGTTLAGYMAWLRRDGWKLGKLDLCPQCHEKRNAQKSTTGKEGL